MTITRPTGLNLQAWADSVVLDVEPIATIGRIQGDDWQNWGVQLLSTAFNRYSIPTPFAFTSWDAWAELVCKELA